jgi:CheY-like chemotaxis protein
VLFLLQKELEAAGFEVWPAASAEAALALLARRGHPHLAVVDIVLPGLDGLALGRRLRQESGIPVILLTSIDEEETVARAIEEFTDDYIRKPFRSRELVARVERLYRRVHASGQGDAEAVRKSLDALESCLAERRALDNLFLGRYQVLEVLGTGAMGTVCRGWDPKLQREVALKTVRLAGGVPPARKRDLIETLKREAVALARLSHPNVVVVYDFADAPDAGFIAMEYIEGLSLEDLLERRRQLAPDEVIPLAAGIAAGLAAAHSRGIVHRDVKPANVLLGFDGSIKVMDFGIAGFLAQAQAESGSVFGTPGYVPPESLLGAGHAEPGDLFSLGVLMYNCLAGRLPFRGQDLTKALESTVIGRYEPLAPQVPGLPGALETLVQELLKREPHDRPASAAVVAARLEEMAAGGRLRWRLKTRRAPARG